MFKRFSIIGLATVLVTGILLLGMTGIVGAQDTPPDGTCPYGGTCGGYGMGIGGRGGFGYRGTMPALLAEALDMTTEELYAAQADGQTIAELAATQGIALDTVVEALVAPRVELLEQAVSEGRITQEQADGVIETITAHMAERLEDSGLGYGGYGGGCGGTRMGGGHRGSRWGRSGSYAPRSPGSTMPSSSGL